MRTIYKILIAIPILVIFGTVLFWKYATSPKSYDPPRPSSWTSETPRGILQSNGVVPISDRFRSLHTDVRNSDELLGAVGPMLELDWIAEPDMFIPDGPAVDNNNHVYFSPVFPRENVMLVSIDGESGKRRWAIKSDLPISPQGSGGPLILNDIEHPGEEIIYVGHFSRAVAVRTNGDIVWDRSTGLPKPQAGQKGIWHNYGLNYHAQTDSLIGAFMMGHMYALDRKTGKPLLRKPWVLPGSMPASETKELPAQDRIKKVDDLMAEVFGPSADGVGRFSRVMDVIFGGGAKIANFFAIDQVTGRIFVAGTSPDELDGKKDNLSEFGALYALELAADGNGFYRFEIVARADFRGGTGSSPTLSADGSRVFISDNFGKVLALDRDLNEIWNIELPEQIAASIAVASDSGELFAVSTRNIYKMEDRGKFGTHEWTATLDMYPEFPWQKNMNILTPTITANGLAVSVGLGLKMGSALLPLKIGRGLIDRETGELMYYKESGEESVSATVLGGNGSFYSGHSPVRRAPVAALLPFLTEPLTGGIGRYKPARLDIFAEHAVCAAAKNVKRAKITLKGHPESARHEIEIVKILMHQAIRALEIDAKEKRTGTRSTEVSSLKKLAKNITPQNLEVSLRGIQSQCNQFGDKLHN